MSAQQILLDVLNRGVQVGVDGQDLSVRAVKGALTSDHREQMQSTKADLIEFIGAGRRLARMSFAQRRMWFIDQLTPGSALYTATAATYRLRGPVDATALASAINTVIQRHEALRTTFPFVNGEPVQSIQAVLAIDLPLTDFSDHPAENRESLAIERASAIVRRPFDLARGPLFRPELIRIDSNDHILVLPMHHIVNDGWSVGVLYRELQELYGADVSGRAPMLPTLKQQYADISEQQYRITESSDGADQLSYWKQQLGGTIPVLNLAGDRAHTASPEFEGARVRTMMDPTIGESLKRLGRKEGASLFMVGLSAYFVLLQRYTRNEDIVVGSPIAGRTLDHSEEVLGLFVNTVALRASVQPDDSIREVIRSVRDTAIGAFANQDVPFDHVVAEVQPDRDLTHSPLFRVMFVLQNAPIPAATMGDARLEPMELDTGTAKFDMSLELVECADGIRATLEYNTELFDEARAQCVLRHYETLLHSMAEDPDQRVADVAMIIVAERQQLTIEFNNTEKTFADMRPVHVRFAEWADRQPDATAVLWENGSLTYAELNRVADGIANELHAARVGRNDIVAVCVPRSPEMIAGQLAVLKAGAAYLSLDPEHPYDRLAHMVRDAGARMLLLSKEHAAEFPDMATISIDLESEGCRDVAFDMNETQPDDLAYVIYTSGSTGTPKGVAIEHGGLSNLAAWHQDAFDVNETDRGSQLASPAFDASVWEIWPYLSAGAALALCPDDVRTEPAAFRDWLLAERVTVGFAPTDVIESMFAFDWPAETSLHHLLTGGAWLNERPPTGLPFTVVNNYGPTENSVVTTSGVVSPVGEAPRLPTIGRPIANHQVYVLDENLRVAPLGVPGELYIGGTGLAREYLNDADRTESHFVNGPADSSSPHRLYKTGDRGRFLADGCIQFLGRSDHQVNVRGYRIELGEIETAAQTHTDVVEAVAMPLAEDHESEMHGRDFGLRLFVCSRESDALPANGEIEQTHVRQWRTLYDDTYADSPINIDPALNIIGWNSSYTGAPIPMEEMREWRDCTVDRLRALNPKRVLEIGCGTGMILAELAPECESYLAVDFSAEALDYVRTNLVERRGLHQVELMQASAHELEGLDGRTFDLVILNSVVQYFPSATYLRGVIENATRLAERGGAVFVGDVRNYALQNQFQTMVQVHSAPSETSAALLTNRINRSIAAEEELLVDPQLFHRVATELPCVSGVHTLIKRGRSENELSQFRYDALLWIGEMKAELPEDSIEWRGDDSCLEEVRGALRSTKIESLRLTGIPNGRMSEAERLWKTLEKGASSEETIHSLLNRDPSNYGVDPESFAELFPDVPYSISFHCALTDSCQYDVLFVRNDAQSRAVCDHAGSESSSSPDTNAPLEAGHLRGLVSELREHLLRQLPAYMIPNRIVPLASFPRTASGKVDRQALCVIDDAAPVASRYVAPRTELEESVVGMWQGILGIERVGVEDNFFELGGHSLLATQLVAQICEAFGVELPLRELFVSPTPAGIAVAIEEALMREIEDLTEDEAARLVAS